MTMARRRRRHRGFGHWAAPLAFLAGVTIAVLLVASALDERTATPTATTATAATTTTRGSRPATTRATTTTAAGERRYYTVVAGDTFGVIAAKTGTSVAELERLNPGVSTTSLFIGQKLRVG
jgi:LysM repeat protein